jgi:hypothetical protein
LGARKWKGLVLTDTDTSQPASAGVISGDFVRIHLPDRYKGFSRATEANMGVDGALLIHVSNRYLDLERVARGAAKYLGFDFVIIRSPKNEDLSIEAADWVVLSRNQALLAKLAPFASQPDSAEKPPVLWTDAHSSRFEIIR